MKSSPERSVFAAFYSEKEARAAEKKIRALGVVTTQIAPLTHYGNEDNNPQSIPIAGKISSLANLTLGTNPQSRDASILLASDPAASGMSDGQGEITGRNYLLTVVCNEPLVDRVVRIIKEENGYT